ncbi:MAG: sigma-54-dependent transcriptional regulator [Acidobacteriota bacterium]|nr:sigma-54 dependent transcriptional regulator [Bryobacteraceae bacterium CoA2 C42]
MPPPVTILAVDDDPLSRELLSDALRPLPVRVLTAAHPDEAMAAVLAERPAIVILDLLLPGRSGLALTSEILAAAPTTDVLLLTGHYTPESAIEAIRLGACDYLTKPIQIAALRARISRLLDDLQKRLEAARLETELVHAHRFEGMVGYSPRMLELFALIRRAAPHFRVALIRGATGTGKELAAAALHRQSPVAAGPFVVCNCSAITETLFESEMFGHRKGAFTGATHDKPGMFEAAHGGTLFLDELGDLPFAMQSKLLRAIQQQEIRPVGANTPRKISCRVIAATNRDLETMMAAGEFREDLYYRLSMVELHLPPLAGRMEDFPYLVRAFLERYAAEYGKPLQGLTPRAQAVLARHPWPGNIRELENVIGRAAMMTESDLIDVRDLPAAFQRHLPAAPPPAPEMLPLAEVERRHTRWVLDQLDGNKSKAADLLGITRSTLYRILGEAP